MSNPRWTPADRPPPSRARMIWFKMRNFLSGRFYKFVTRMAMRWEIRKRRKLSAKYDPVWKESWWVLERRYSKLAKRFSKLELKYLMAKDLLKQYSDDTKTFDHNGEGKHEQLRDTDK